MIKVDHTPQTRPNSKLYPDTDTDISNHSPAAAAFRKTFRTFIRRTDADVDKFMLKAQRTTDEFIEAATTWKRNAQEATEEATAAIAVSNRSLQLRKVIEEEDVDAFLNREYARAEASSKHAKRLSREANEAATLAATSEPHPLSLASFASGLRRSADAASEEAQEAFDTVAYDLKVRAEDESIDQIVERDQSAAELATVKETRAKRELYFAEKDLKKRVAFFEKEKKLRAEFPATASVDEKMGRKR